MSDSQGDVSFDESISRREKSPKDSSNIPENVDNEDESVNNDLPNYEILDDNSTDGGQDVVDEADDDIDDEGDNDDNDMARHNGKDEIDDDKIQPKVSKKRKRPKKSEFIDDEAELSGDDVVSEDEAEQSDDDQIDPELVDQNASELDSEEEEEVRGLYHKQLETEDKRALLLLQEHFEDKDVALGQRRRKKFRWQTRELIENSLRRHYDPDDDDTDTGDDDEDDDFDYEANPRLRRPTAEALLIGTTRVLRKNLNKSVDTDPEAGNSSNQMMNDDSNSRLIPTTSTKQSTSTVQVTSDINKFLFRDRDLVQALSTKETVILTREERDRNLQRELRKVMSSKSIFDQLYS